MLRKIPFIYSCIGTGIGGVILGAFRVTSSTAQSTTVFETTPADFALETLFYAYIGGLIVAFLVSFLLTLFCTKQIVIDPKE